MRTPIVILCLALFICGCASTSVVTDTTKIAVTPSKPSTTLTQEQEWKLMTGKWYGSQPTKDGGTKQEIVERTGQGAYKVVFRIKGNDGSVEEHTEAGNWGVSGPVYFTIFRGYIEGTKFTPVDPSDPYNYDAYRIVQLSDEAFEYEHFTSGNKYTLKRVSSNFEFPQ